MFIRTAWRYLVTVSAIALLWCGPSAAEPIKHSFFVAGPTFTGIIDEDGKETWNSGRGRARDGQVLSNGNVLIAWGDEVKEFTRDKKVVFHYATPATCKELGTVQRLPGGRTLISPCKPLICTNRPPPFISSGNAARVICRAPLTSVSTKLLICS